MFVVALALAAGACKSDPKAETPASETPAPTGKGRIVVEGSANQRATP
jgi:hypothetical protein